MDKKIKIGISACLLGKNVRFDGGSLKPELINKVFSKFFSYVSFCPEVEIGMSIPRETIRLQKQEDEVRLIAPKSGNDYTNTMKNYSIEKVASLAKLNISGFILKKDSPSCGMERIKIYDPNKVPQKSGIGIFAEILMQKFPLLPVEEEGRLNDIKLREHWVERVFALDRLKRFLAHKPDRGQIMSFHANHKLQLMVHHPEKYRKLGKEVAAVHTYELQDFYHYYEKLFLEIMQHKPSGKKHVDVLYHIMGFFKKDITAQDKKECIDLIEQFRQGQVPIVVPLTILNHHLKKFPVEWLAAQTYLNPYPQELMLRSYV